jgi:hypothetical protein
MVAGASKRNALLFPLLAFRGISSYLTAEKVGPGKSGKFESQGRRPGAR